jgi:hypothetical protein
MPSENSLFAVAAPFTTGIILPIETWKALLPILEKIAQENGANGFTVRVEPFGNDLNDIRTRIEFLVIPNGEEFSEICEEMNPTMELWQACLLRGSKGIYEMQVDNYKLSLVRID